MNHFKAFDLADVVHRLASLHYSIQSGKEDVANKKLPADSLPVKEVCEALERAETVCKEADLTQAAESAALTLGALKIALDIVGDTDLSTLESDLRHVLLDVLREMRPRKFLFIASDRTDHLDQDAAFGPKVFNGFPSARNDIREAGNCLATELHTAAVFYLMRVAEHGLRTLARRLKVKLTHKGNVHPIEFADWEKVITAIKNEIIKVRALNPGPKKQAKLDRYSDAADHCLFMRDIWRNNISHARRPYSRLEAGNVFERVRDFMNFLARR